MRSAAADPVRSHQRDVVCARPRLLQLVAEAARKIPAHVARDRAIYPLDEFFTGVVPDLQAAFGSPALVPHIVSPESKNLAALPKLDLTAAQLVEICKLYWFDYALPGAVPKYVHQLYRVRRVPPFDVLALSPPFRFPDYFGSGDARDKLQYAMGVRARAVAAAGSASSTYELEVAYGVGDCVALMHTLRGSLECLGLE